jgi:hypothetical protein
MNRFIRPTRKSTDSTKLNFATAKKTVLLDPGLYELRIEHAEAVGRTGNTSVALKLTDIASGQIIATKPMWVAGPNARSGDLAEQNKATIADLLRLAGQPLEGDSSVLLKGLVGLRFLGDLGIENDRNANPYNNLRGAEPVDPDESVRDE